mgnify:CR=1 FL=1
MKKRVCSILLAAVLCVTMLSVVALADECQHDWEYKDTGAGLNCIGTCKICKAESYPVQHCDIVKDGKCDYCNTALAVSFNDIYRSCATTWEAAFKYIGSTSGTLYPIADTTETITYNEKGNVTINVTGKTLNNLTLNSGKVTLKHNEVYDGASTVKNVTVTGGTLKIEGNSHLTVTNLNISANAKAELSGGTYGTITPPAGKSVNDLLAPGYYAVQTANGISVQQAPITNVTVSVSNNDNTVYGYSEADAPVLTATVTPSDLQGVTYQWYKVNSSEKTAIDNATAQTYTVETGLNAGNYDYCCTATVDTYPLTSDDVTVTIKKANGPQLGTINVNQVYNDTASKTIEIYDQVIGKLNEAFPNGGTMEFQGDGYESADGLTLNGWQIDVNSGSITYTMGENTAPEKKITIKYKAFAHEGNYKNNYEYAEGTVVITLTKITPTGTPNYTSITSSGKTLADAHLNADNNAFSVPGTVMWAVDGDPESVKVEKGTAYEWIFRPDDYEHFEVIRGSIILWTESGSGVVIIVPSQSGESTPASNPNTGAAHVGQPLPGLALLALAALCLYAGTRRF